MKAESRDLKAESRDLKAESREPRAESREQLIRDSIANLRDADQRVVPSFESVLARKRADEIVVWHVGRLAVAAALVVAAGIGVVYAANRPRLTVPSEVIALSTWRGPTDVLLETPTTRFLRATQNVDSTLYASRIP